MQVEGFLRPVIQQQNTGGALEVPTLPVTNLAFDYGSMEMGTANPTGDDSEEYQ